MLRKSIGMHPTSSVCVIAISAWVMWSLQTSHPGPSIVGILSGWLQGLIGSYCILATVKVKLRFISLLKLGCAVVYVGFFEIATISMFADFPLHYDRFPVVGRVMELAVVPALFTSAVILAGFNNTKRIADLLIATLLVALGIVAINSTGFLNCTSDVQLLVFWYSTVAVTTFSVCIFNWRLKSKKKLTASATILCSSIVCIILIDENGLAFMRILACTVQFGVIGFILWLDGDKEPSNGSGEDQGVRYQLTNDCTASCQKTQTNR